MGFVADIFVGSKQAKATEKAADLNADTQRYIYDDSVTRQQPFLDSAYGALDIRDDLLGLGGGQQQAAAQGQYGSNSQMPRKFMGADGPGIMRDFEDVEARGGGYGQPQAPAPQPQGQGQSAGENAFYNSLFYRAPFDEGQGAIEGGAAARGGLLSGQTAKDVINYGQQQGSNNFMNYFNATNSAAGAGQIANQSLNNAGTNYANGITNSNNMQAAATQQKWGAIGDGINGGIGALATIFGG